MYSLNRQAERNLISGFVFVINRVINQCIETIINHLPTFLETERLVVKTSEKSKNSMHTLEKAQWKS